jgi:hypothetical protein
MEKKMAGAFIVHGREEDAYEVLVVRRERKRPLGRSKHTWEDVIKMDRRGMGWSGFDCINLA